MTRNVSVALGALVLGGGVGCNFVVPEDTSDPRVDRVVASDPHGLGYHDTNTMIASLFIYGELLPIGHVLYADTAVTDKYKPSNKVPQYFTSYSLYFNKVLDGCTIVGGADCATQPTEPPIELWEGATKHPVVLGYDPGRRRITVDRSNCHGDPNPLPGLKPGTEYKIVIKAGIKDLLPTPKEVPAQEIKFELAPFEVIAVHGTDDDKTWYLHKAVDGHAPEKLTIQNDPALGETCKGRIGVHDAATCEGSVHGAYFAVSFTRDVACDYVDADNGDLRDKRIKLLLGTEEISYSCDVWAPLGFAGVPEDVRSLGIFPDRDLESDKEYKLVIADTTAGGCGTGSGGDKLAGAVEVSFKTAKFPFEVITVSPAANSTTPAPTTNVNVTFTAPVDPATVTATSFTLVDDAGAAVTSAVTVSDDGWSASLNPEPTLTRGKKYTASLKGVKTKDGSTTMEDWSSSFTPVLFRPTAASPGDNAVNVSRATAQIRVTFNGTLDAATVGPQTAALLKEDGTLIPTQVSVDPANGARILLEINPTEFTFDYGAIYQIRVTDQVKEAVSGDKAALAWRSRFRIAAAPPAFRGSADVDSDDVATDVTIGVAFVGANGLDATTWTAANVKLTKASDGSEVALNLSTPGEATPNAALENDTTYVFSVSTGVKDTAGNALNAPIEAEFRTVCATPDAADPDFCE